jgi:hypothetical protein
MDFPGKSLSTSEGCGLRGFVFSDIMLRIGPASRTPDLAINREPMKAA